MISNEPIRTLVTSTLRHFVPWKVKKAQAKLKIELNNLNYYPELHKKSLVHGHLMDVT